MVYNNNLFINILHLSRRSPPVLGRYTLRERTHLNTLTIRELLQHAQQLGVNQADLDTADDRKERIAQLIMLALQIEVTIRQEGLSRVAISARCHAGGHFAMLRENAMGSRNLHSRPNT